MEKIGTQLFRYFNPFSIKPLFETKTEIQRRDCFFARLTRIFFLPLSV